MKRVKRDKMKKVLLIIGIILMLLIIGGVGFYFWGITPKDNNDNVVVFTIEPGTSKTVIAKNLAKAGLIKSDIALDVYLFFNKINIQAGDYELSSNMKPEDMLKKFSAGDVKINSSTITLVEGKRLVDYAEDLAEKLDFSKNDFLSVASDQEFLANLIPDYWFLSSDILNESLYYPLEGYLYPDTYEFLNNVSPEEVIKTILDHTALKLEDIKDVMLANSYSVHELLTLASIVEKEANSDEERQTVAQVFYKRLAENWSLGSDVTAFYGAKKEMGKDSETWEVLNGDNPYNTRLTNGTMNGKLPIGPICSPSLSSITAILNPSATNYYYFVANTCTGEITFLTTADEFYAKTTELSTNGCI